MPPQEIDRPSVAEDGERHFDLHLPGARLEICGDLAHDGCVPFVQESIELAASPPDDLHKIRIESREDTGDRAHRQVVDLSALEARDLALADTPSPCHIDLAPSEAMS